MELEWNFSVFFAKLRESFFLGSASGALVLAAEISILYNDLGVPPVVPVFILPSPDLQSAGNAGHASFLEVLTDELCCISPGNAINEIHLPCSVLIFEVPLASESEGKNRSLIICISEIKILCETSLYYYLIKHFKSPYK